MRRFAKQPHFLAAGQAAISLGNATHHHLSCERYCDMSVEGNNEQQRLLAGLSNASGCLVRQAREEDIMIKLSQRPIGNFAVVLQIGFG